MASASVLLTRREAAEIGRVPLNAIDKAIEQGVMKPKRKQGKPLLPAHEVALLVLLRQIDVALPTKAKGSLRRLLAEAQPRHIQTEREREMFRLRAVTSPSMRSASGSTSVVDASTSYYVARMP
jgi:hypothetical protein